MLAGSGRDEVRVGLRSVALRLRSAYGTETHVLSAAGFLRWCAWDAGKCMGRYKTHSAAIYRGKRQNRIHCRFSNVSGLAARRRRRRETSPKQVTVLHSFPLNSFVEKRFIMFYR